MDLGLAANALTLGAVPWTLRTVDPGVGCYKRDGPRGVMFKCGEFFSLFLDKGLDVFLGNPRKLVFIYIFLRISYIQWVWRNQTQHVLQSLVGGRILPKNGGPRKISLLLPSLAKVST